MSATQVHKEGNIGVISLYRPNNRNALNGQMANEVIAAMDAFSVDDSVKVVVLTATPAPHKSFCAGADLAPTEGTKGAAFTNVGLPDDHRDVGGMITLAILRCTKPTVCITTGHAAGVGFNMQLPCDIRVGWKDAKLLLPFAKIGIVPEGCSSFFLPKLLGTSKALQIFMTGRTFNAKDDVMKDLYLHLEDTPELAYKKGFEVARELAYNSALSMLNIKKMVWANSVGGLSPYNAHLLESRILFDQGNSTDTNEGVRAFLEKRKPAFKGLQKEASTSYPGWASDGGVWIRTKL